MSEQEVIDKVIYSFVDELEKFNFKIHKNILPYTMDLTDFYKSVPGYYINVYTWDYHVRLQVIDLQGDKPTRLRLSKPTDKIIHNENYHVDDYKKMNRSEKIKEILNPVFL